LTFSRSLGRVFTYVTFGLTLAVAQPNPSTNDHDTAAWLDRLLEFKLPKMPAFLPLTFGAASSSCSVAPLSTIEEAGAVSFETAADTAAVVDTAGLTPQAASALTRLQQMIASIGRKIELKSAYRPPAYQEHLQEVWDKWKALKRTRQPGCHDLRAEVGTEFTRHHLLETQRPVSNSDHTRGVGIDAAVKLPAGARWNRRRISLDRLVQIVGFKRPDIRHDPVHFRLLASSPSSSTTISAD
jgi:D-alanyl-D-alanine dipeptidase